LATAEHIATWLDSESYRLSGRGLWTLGGEPGTPRPEEFQQAGLRVLLVRLSPYDDVSLSMSHPLVAALFEASHRSAGSPIFVDFGYTPYPRDAALLEGENIPLLFGTTSRQPAEAFDLLALSCSHPSEFLNIPWLLRGSSIPLSRTARLRQADLPLVLLGGAVSSHSGVLHGDAEGPGSGGLVDGVVVGEGEDTVPAITAILAEAWRDGSTKAEKLARMRRGVPGFYDPGAYTHKHAGAGRGPLVAIESTQPEVPLPVIRCTSFPASEEECAGQPVCGLMIPYHDRAAGIATLEISRGCPCFCTFCREGHDHKPYRERSAAALRSILARAKALLGAEDVNLASFNFNTHGEIYPILLAAAQLFDRVRVKSQRFDVLAKNPEMAPVTTKLGKRVYTLGLEGISQRLRNRLGKGISTQDVLDATQALAAAGAGELKIFVIATGHEKGADLGEFRELLRDLEATARAHSRGSFRMVVSLTPLITQPHTPLQRQGRGIPPGRFEKVRSSLRAICRESGLEFRTAASVYEINTLQLLTTGDRRVTPALVATSLGGTLYFGEIPRKAESVLFGELEKLNIDPQSLFAPLDPSAPLPWDDISSGLPRGNGAQSRAAEERASAATTTAGSPPATAFTSAAPSSGELEDIIEAKRFPLSMTFAVCISNRLRRVPRAFFPRALARGLMLTEERLVRSYLRPGQVAGPPYPFTAGKLSIELLFRQDTPEELLDLMTEPGFLERVTGLWPDIEVVSGAPGAPAGDAGEPVRYTILFPAGIPQAAVTRAVARPGRGKPLPLTLEKQENGYRLRPQGKKAKSCPVLMAELEDSDGGGLRLSLTARASFDPGRIVTAVLPGVEALRAIVRQV